MKVFIAISFIMLLILLLKNKYRASVLFTGLASIYFILDLIKFDDLVKGFTNSSLLSLVLLLLVSISLEKTIFIDYFSKFIISKSYGKTFLKFAIVILSYSAFVSNTAVVASLIGAVRNNKYHSPSKLLIPLSYFAILGGTLTLVGTSTNLLVNSFVISNNHESLKIFDFFYVGFFIALFGLITLYLTKSFLPDNGLNNENIEKHLIELKVSKDSKLISKSIKENKLRNLEYLFLVEIVREGNAISPVSPNEIIKENDKLIFSGDIKYIDILKKFDGLILVDDIKNNDIKTLNLVDTIVSSESSLIGKKVKEVNFREEYDAAIISFKRGSSSILKIGEEIVQVGDRLILAVGKEFINKENSIKNFYILSNIKQNEKFDKMKSIFIIFGFASIILISALEYLTLFKALCIALIGLLFLKILSLSEIKKRFPYEIYMIIGSSIAISKVLVSSGIANDVAQSITNSLGVYGVYGSFIGIYLVTLFLTQFISHNATAAIVFPIAAATATGLDSNLTPFAFAVAFGASASFLIPYGYQTNLMVNSLGGYKIKDFFKIGSILTFVYSITVIVFVPLFFRF